MLKQDATVEGADPKPQSLIYPIDRSLPSDGLINCRCIVSPVLISEGEEE